MVRIFAEAALIVLIVAGLCLEIISTGISWCGRFLKDKFCGRERGTSGSLFENFLR